MAVANTLAYYITATIAAVKSLIEQGTDGDVVNIFILIIIVLQPVHFKQSNFWASANVI
jgi:hypothetical protein